MVHTRVLAGFVTRWCTLPLSKVTSVPINQPTSCNNFPSLLLEVYVGSTCFGRPHAHTQELNNCSSSLWFYSWSVVIAVLLVVVGPAGRPDHDQQHFYHHAPTVEPEAATAVIELLMMGMRMPETCGAVFKRQVINLRNCCIWLVDSFERLYRVQGYRKFYW